MSESTSKRYFVVDEGSPLAERFKEVCSEINHMQHLGILLAEEYGATAAAWCRGTISGFFFRDGNIPDGWIKKAYAETEGGGSEPVYLPKMNTREGRKLKRKIDDLPAPDITKAFDVVDEGLPKTMIMGEQTDRGFRMLSPGIGRLQGYLVALVPQHDDTPFQPPEYMHEIKHWQFERLKEEGVLELNNQEEVAA